MKLSLLCLAVAAIGLASRTRAAEEAASPNVIDAAPTDFDAIVAQGHALVGFFAPWCGHCKAIKPAWNRVADLFADEPDVSIVSVDADKHRSLGERFEVQGFPSLKYFPAGGGKPVAYDGGRSEKDLVAFLNEKADTDVRVDGSPSKKNGLLPEVHDILAGFGEASAEEKEAKLREAGREVAGGGDKEAKFRVYAKVGAKILAEGAAYVAREKARLAAMLANGKGSITPTQRKNFQRRINVLTVFDEL